jgi:putative oxidoreductase
MEVFVMNNVYQSWDYHVTRFSRWLAPRSIAALRVSLGLVFLGFGVLKFFPDVSPAEDLAKQTMAALTLGLVPEWLGIYFVAALETAIGLCLLSRRFQVVGLALLGVAMVGVLSPLVLFPDRLFPWPAYTPTLEAQYVLKDIVLLAATLVLTASLLGRRSAAPPPD